MKNPMVASRPPPGNAPGSPFFEIEAGTPRCGVHRIPLSALSEGGERVGVSARVSRAGLGVAPEPLVEAFSLGNGFWRDAENGNRDGRAPQQRPYWWPCASTGQRQFGMDDQGKGCLNAR
jgi:hypothetical protein